jgi:hypothetical protein
MPGALDNAGEWVYCGTVMPDANGQWAPFPTKSDSSNTLIRLTYYFQNNTPIWMYGQIRVRYEFPVKATGKIFNFYPAEKNRYPKDTSQNIEIFDIQTPQELSWNPTTVLKAFEVRKQRTSRQIRWGTPVAEQGWAVSLEFLNYVTLTPEIQGIIQEDSRILNVGNTGSIHILLKDATP